MVTDQELREDMITDQRFRGRGHDYRPGTKREEGGEGEGRHDHSRYEGERGGGGGGGRVGGTPGG